MGAEPARIVAAPRSALGGAAPKREAAEAKPLPPPPAREDRGPREYGDRPPRREYGDRPPRRDAGDRPPRREYGDRPAGDRPPRRDDRGRRDDRRRDERPARGGSELSAAEVAAVTTARGSLAMERAELEAAEATPEALAAGKEILEAVMGHLGFEGVSVEVREGETSRLNVVGDGADREALGSLIGRKGERLSALQHLVNLMLSRRTGQWTRVLVDVEDYRGRRERQLVDLASRAADRVAETGKMLQLEPMPALERRWIHLALRDNANVATQSIGEEPNRRVVVLPRAQ
jgi:spoIIIJ-associated protein